MSVAIRAITRIQDADDVNVSLGAGVDEYALSWDNDTAKFVLRAVAGGGGVTDHGALTGLNDDDHSQYLLATGARTGASSQGQTFTNGIIGPSWIGGSAVDQAVTLKLTSGVSSGSYMDIVGGNNGSLLIVRFNGTNGTISVPGPLHVAGASGYIGCESGAYIYQIGGTTYLGDTLVNFNASTNFIIKPRTDGQHLILLPDSGNLGVGTSGPSGKLHVDQASTTAAIPVLTVDQADVSEEFVRFIGASTTDASQSLVDAADRTTPGSIVGWLKIYVQDDASSGAITDGVYYVPFYSAPSA